MNYYEKQIGRLLGCVEVACREAVLSQLRKTWGELGNHHVRMLSGERTRYEYVKARPSESPVVWSITARDQDVSALAVVLRQTSTAFRDAWSVVNFHEIQAFALDNSGGHFNIDLEEDRIRRDLSLYYGYLTTVAAPESAGAFWREVFHAACFGSDLFNPPMETHEVSVRFQDLLALLGRLDHLHLTCPHDIAPCPDSLEDRAERSLELEDRAERSLERA